MNGNEHRSARRGMGLQLDGKPSTILIYFLKDINGVSGPGVKVNLGHSTTGRGKGGRDRIRQGSRGDSPRFSIVSTHGLSRTSRSLTTPTLRTAIAAEAPVLAKKTHKINAAASTAIGVALMTLS